MIVRALLRRRSYLFSIIAVVLLLSTIVPVAYWATFSTSTSMYESSIKAYAPDLLYATTAAVAPSSFINRISSGLGLGNNSNGLLGEALLLENITRRAAPPGNIVGLPVVGGAGTFIVLNIGSLAWNITYNITGNVSAGEGEILEGHGAIATVSSPTNIYSVRSIEYKSLADFYASRALKYSQTVRVEAAGGLYLNYTSLPVRIVFYRPGSLDLLGLKVEPVESARNGGIPVIVNPLLYYLLENITGSPPTTLKVGRAEFRITGLAVSGLEGYLKYWSGLGYYPAGEIYVPRSMLDTTIQLVSDPSGYSNTSILLSLIERAKQYGVTPNLTLSEARNLSLRKLVVVPDLDALLVSGKPVKRVAEHARSLGFNLSSIAPVLSEGWAEKGNSTIGGKATTGAGFVNWYSIVSAYTAVNYDPYYIASKGTAVLYSGLPELYNIINNRSAETYRLLAHIVNATTLSPQTILPPPENGSAPACYYTPGRFVPPTIERHHNSVIITGLTGEPFTLRCRNGWFLMSSLTRDSILDIIESNGNVQTSVPVTITYTSIIPGLLVVMGLAIATGIGLLVASSRRWLAVYVARGGDPVRASRRLSLVLTLLSLPIATLGFGLVCYAIVAFWGGLGSANMLLLYAASLGLAAATVLLVSYKKSLELKTIEPGEAVRPLTLLQQSSVRVGGRGMSLLAALSVIVIAVGEARLNPDAIFNSLSSSLVYGLLVVVFMIAYFLGPFTPLLALYYYGKALSSSKRLNRELSRTTSIVFRRGGGLLGRESGERLLQTVLAPLQALATSIGLMVAGLWISSGIVRNYVESGLAALLAANDIIGMSDVQGLQNSARLLRDIGYIAGLTSIIIASIAVVTLYSSIKREIAVLRARGAGRRDTAGFVYASLTPLLVSSIILGLLLGFIVVVAYDSILGLYIASSSNLPFKHVPGSLAPYTWLAAPRPGDLAYAVLVFTVILVLPLMVMLEMLREENIASILRG